MFALRKLLPSAVCVLAIACVYVYARPAEEGFVTTDGYTNNRYDLDVTLDEDNNEYVVLGFGVMNPGFQIPPAQAVEANIIITRISDGRFLGSRTINMQSDGFFNSAVIYMSAGLNPADPNVTISADVFCSGCYYKTYDFPGRMND